MQIIIKDKSHLREASRRFLNHVIGKRIFAFYGPMGSGKTTIIKSICELLGATGIVTSPSFTLINEYTTGQGEVLYHIDFYRIRKTEEVFDFGIEEYFSSGAYCFMEWPELVESLLPPETLRIRIIPGDSEQRTIVFE